MSDSKITKPDELFGFRMEYLSPEGLRALANYCEDLESLTDFEWKFRSMSRTFDVVDGIGPSDYLRIGLTPVDRFNFFTEEGWEVYHQKKWFAKLLLYKPNFQKIAKGRTPLEAYANLVSSVDECSSLEEGIISLTKNLQK